MKYTTYTNRTNRHVAIHNVGCKMINKNGGTNPDSKVKQEYKNHATLIEALEYARTTGLEIKQCKICNPK